MRIDVITLFPEVFESLRQYSIIGRALKKEEIKLKIHNLRDWAKDSYKSVDSRPYGGGAGMVLRVDIVAPAIEEVKKQVKGAKVILLTPQGKKYRQREARRLAKEKSLILVCGHYEGWDERIRKYIDEELSIGDYILTGGEIPAWVVIDSVARLLPGVLGNESSSAEESFTEALLEYPQYTRPREYEGRKVPAVLLRGNHAEIGKWRREQARKKTKEFRPDLTE